MGDVAMTVPVLEALRKAYPSLNITMLTRSFYEPFFASVPDITIHNIDLGNYHRGVVGTWRLYRELKDKYDIDLIIDLNDKLYSKLLRRFFKFFSSVDSFHINKGRAEKKALTRQSKKEKHQLRSSVARYADVFIEAGFPIEVDMVLRKEKRRNIPIVLGEKYTKWIGIAPFAKHQGKIIPMETIEELIRLLAKSNPKDRIFIFGGGAQEKEAAEKLEDKFNNSTSLVGRITLTEELDLISNLDIMVSMDSSAMHMSSLVGTKVVSVWGATHHYAGFLGAGQSVDNIVEIEDLECRPCSVYGHKPCIKGTYECLKRIEAKQIHAKILENLSL